MKDQDKKRLQKIIAMAVIVMFATQMGWLSALGIHPIDFSGTGIIPPVGQGDEVYFKISVKESLGAYASEDIIVNAYGEAACTTYLGSATASSGLASFTGFSIVEGSHVWLQGRQGPPSTADGYITPVTEFIVGFGDPTDTVTAKNAVTGESTLWVDNLHDSTEPVFTFYAPDEANLASGSVDNLTTADLYFTMSIRIAEDECWYGAPDFTDAVSGEKYLGGIWVLMSGATDYTFTQGSARFYHKWSVGSVIYHAWNFNTRLWQDSLRTGDVNSASFTFTLANGADFDQGADTLTLDVFDMMLDTGSWSASNFVDGGGLAPAAVTAYID